MVIYCRLLFFFKQKPAYEMRISDWSSDVCSSDLLDFANDFFHQILNGDQAFRARIFVKHNGQMGSFGPHFREKIKHAHGFGHIEWLPDKHSEIGGGWLTPSQYRESIANMDHSDYGIEAPPVDRNATRSEEHTSELQSLMRIPYAVLCLKKKNNN